jgi:peroxiredoxin
VHDPLTLPPDLPAPVDDGAADDLVGRALPSLALPSTAGVSVDLATTVGRSVVFAYPRTGRPGEESLGGDASWNAIPGARGCTPQACAIRDEHARFVECGATVFGLSTQSPADQAEAAERLHLPYCLLSDEDLALTRAIGLPTFEVEGVTLLKRLTLFVRGGSIEHVQYPVFPPDAAAQAALAWLA